jgi:glycosyltransferase involved in cell wall biosynthesis
MQLRGRKLLFISQKAGFFGGVERYIFQVGALLRREGVELWGAFAEMARDSDRFRKGFDRLLSFRELLALQEEFDLVGVHKLADNALLEYLLERYGERLALFVHDHDAYCPRAHKYFPFSRRNCHLPYARLRCAACAMASSPRRWQGGLRGELREKLSLFPRRLALCRQFPVAVVLSQFMRDNLLANGFAPERIALIPPYIPLPDPAPPRPAAQDGAPPQIIFVAQLIRGKGADLLLRLLPLLRQPHRVEIVGDGKDRAMLQDLAASLGVSERVEFSGWSLKPEDKMAAADLAVLPFRWQEPFGLVVAECATAGLPVAAFALGGVGESLIHGETGLLAAPGNLSELAEHCNRLLSDAALRQQMGQRGREFIKEKFSQERVLDGYTALFARVAAAADSAP